MNPFEYALALSTAWMDGGKALFKAQEAANHTFSEQTQAMLAGKWPGLSTEVAAGQTDLAEAGQSFSALWTAAGSLFAALSGGFSASGANQTVEATLRHMVDPRSWLAGGGQMDEVLARMAEGPRLADLWDTERRYVRVMQAWMQMRRRALDHNAVVLQAWMRAGQNFMGQLSAVKDSQAGLTLWINIANQELLETQRSEPFLQSQSEMIRASIDLRLAQQDLVEHAGKHYGFPTRSEIDDVHRTVTELRREVRALRRAQAPSAPSQTADEPKEQPAVKSLGKSVRPSMRANGSSRHRGAPSV